MAFSADAETGEIKQNVNAATANAGAGSLARWSRGGRR